VCSQLHCELVETGPLVYLPDPLVHAIAYAVTLVHRGFFWGVMTRSVVGCEGARGVGK
jgi:hypothetical protein